MAFQSGPSLLQWYDSSSALRFSTLLSHCVHLTIVYMSSLQPLIAPYSPTHFLGCVWRHTQTMIAVVSWTNRGHISLAGNTMPLWKCSVNYWAMSKHPLCHFRLSYLRFPNGGCAWLLSSQGHLICLSRRTCSICSRSIASLLGCPGWEHLGGKWEISMEILPAACLWKGIMKSWLICVQITYSDV